MPGNRALYDRAMEQSREAARQKNWEEALKQAVRALQEFPQDSDARSSAAVALFNNRKFPQALQIFEELRANDQKNPFFLEYVARTHEEMGTTLQAVSSYSELAELQISRRLQGRAVDALRDALRLRSDNAAVRLRLARLLEEVGNRSEAAAEYLTLARQYQEETNYEKAVQEAEKALDLDANNREAKELLSALHEQLANDVGAGDMGGAGDYAPSPTGMTGGLRSQQFAIEKVIALAQEHQEAGDILGAIEQYNRAIAMGLERSDVFYSLGLLYQEQGNHQAAVDMLSRSVSDADYALSAHFSLGASYEILGQLPQAAQEYEQTLRLVDINSIGKAESEDLIQMYESTANIYIQMNDIARAASLYSTLANFLQNKRWGKERSAEFRQRAKELTERNMFAKLRTLGTGVLSAPEPSMPAPAPVEEAMPETWGKIRPITDFLRPERVSQESDDDPFASSSNAMSAGPVDPLASLEALPLPEKPQFDPVTPLDTTGLDEICERYVIASEKYIEQGLVLAAVDACMEIIRLRPDYLPIHLRLGEIYEREGRPEEALSKYQLLIDTYMVRDEPRRAIDVYWRLIELSPDTINARLRLADLLRSSDRSVEAAEQLGIVAATYFRMGQTNKALEEYRRALQWAPDSATIHAQYGQGLLKLERYEAALSEFRQALELDQSDLLGIARMNMALALLGDQPTAIWQSLATLLEQLKGKPELYSEVQSEYRSVLLFADEPILHYILGIIQQQAGQHPSALMEFEQAASMLAQDEDPILPQVLVHQAMADSYISLGQANEALEQLKLGQAVAPATPPALEHGARFPFSTPLSQGDMVRRMAEAYAASDDLEGAEQALTEAKKHLPYDRAIYTKLADIYFRQGRLNEALAQLDELATYYENRQDLDKAIETLEYAAKLGPNSISNGGRLARLYIRRGFLDKGIDGLTRVAEQQRKAGQLKDAVASLQQIAEIHWTLGRQEETRVIYDKIIQIAPNDIDARQWLALMHTLAGRNADAIAEKKQIVRIFIQTRDYDNAIAELHQIIGLDRNDVDAYFQLGDALMRRQEYEQAYRIYGRLLKMPDVDTERVEALVAAAKRMADQKQQAQV
jgi:tetratricopeptide (TPR) repeat protein